MNLHVDGKTARLHAEDRRLWQDGRVWLVNCVALEAGWRGNIAREYLGEARWRRDAMLAALVAEW